MQHQRTQKGGRIIWDEDDWKAGLGAQGSFSTTQYLKMNEPSGWAYLSNIDPFLNYGMVRPGAPTVEATNSAGMTGAILSANIGNSTYLYGVESNGKLDEYNYVTGTLTSGASAAQSGITFPHTITGTTPVGQDTMIYRHNFGGTTTQVNSLFYSYYVSPATPNWDVGAITNFFPVSGSAAFDDDFMSTVPTTPLDITSGDGDDVNQVSAPHPMCVGSDDILYIGSGRYLHAYDGATGANGTFQSKVLTLPNGFQIIGLRKYQDLLLIVGNYYSTTADGQGEALLYSWNYNDLDVTQVVPLEDPYVSALFMWQGVPTVITSGTPERNGANKIKIITGNNVTKKYDFNGTTPTQRGVAVLNKVIYVNSGGKILTFGDKYEESNAINNTNNCNPQGASGFLLLHPIYGIIASSGTLASGYSVNKFLGNYGSGTMLGKFFEPDLNGKIARIKTVWIDYGSILATNVSNSDLTVFFRTEYGNGTVAQPITNKSSIAVPLRKRYNNNADNTAFPQFTSISPNMQWNGGSAGTLLVSKLTVEYEDLDLPQNT